MSNRILCTTSHRFFNSYGKITISVKKTARFFLNIASFRTYLEFRRLTMLWREKVCSLIHRLLVLPRVNLTKAVCRCRSCWCLTLKLIWDLRRNLFGFIFNGRKYKRGFYLLYTLPLTQSSTLRVNIYDIFQLWKWKNILWLVFTTSGLPLKIRASKITPCLKKGNI